MLKKNSRQIKKLKNGSLPPSYFSILKNAASWGIIFILGLSLFFSFYTQKQVPSEIPITEVLRMIDDGKVSKVLLVGDKLEITTKDSGNFVSRKGPEDFLSLLKAQGIDISKISDGVIEADPSPLVYDLLMLLLQLVGSVLLFVLIFRIFAGKGLGGMGNVFQIGRSKAKLFSTDKPQTKFKDVGGSIEVKRELSEVVDFLRAPQKYIKLGARTPKGVLLVGPSGVGKTLLARAIAGEAKVPFFSVAGSEFMEMLVGVGASRVRDLFSMAKKVSPSIIFIDEIDAIGRQRGFGLTGGHDEREQTLNQILVEMDGFDARTNVIIVAATNRPDLLDHALTRPGRFDRRIALDFPDIEERVEIIKVHMSGKPFADDLDLKKLSRRMVGYSGADIENTLNEAAILAAREGATSITMKDLEEAATKVKLGPERKRLQSEEERRFTAYHEAGHAIVAAKTPKADPVHRISIVSRGQSLGFTMTPPQVDRYNETESRLKAIITVLLGGRAAEQIEFGDFSVGASSDIEQANYIVRKMVTEFGMSPLGPISFDGGPEKAFLRMQFGEYNQVSEAYASKVDAAIQKIIKSGLQEALKALRGNKKLLDRVAQALIEKETLEQDEFESLLKSSG